ALRDLQLAHHEVSGLDVHVARAGGLSLRRDHERDGAWLALDVHADERAPRTARRLAPDGNGLAVPRDRDRVAGRRRSRDLDERHAALLRALPLQAHREAARTFGRGARREREQRKNERERDHLRSSSIRPLAYTVSFSVDAARAAL